MPNFKEYLLYGAIGCLGFIYYNNYGFYKKQIVDQTTKFFQSQDFRRQHEEFPFIDVMFSEFKDAGFDYYNINGYEWGILTKSPDDYWIKDASYFISSKLQNQIIQATFELSNMCYEAIDLVIDQHEVLKYVFQIQDDMIPIVQQSWKLKDRDLLARFDLLYSSKEEEQHGLKMVECNADTPTCLIESGIAQQIWANYTLRHQFNLIDQSLENAWPLIFQNKINQPQKLIGLYIKRLEHNEEQRTVEYIVKQAHKVFPDENRLTQDYESYWQEQQNKVQEEQQQKCIWKLYPYEWLINEESAKELEDIYIKNSRQDIWIEPPWKLLMSSKAMLPLLWLMYPNHPYLLPSYFQTKDAYYDGQKIEDKEWVGKKLYGREGYTTIFSKDYVELKNFEEDVLKEGLDTNINLGRPIFQKLFKQNKCMTRTNTIGSWLIYGVPAGIGIREDLLERINNSSCFVPYYTEQSMKDSPRIQLKCSDNQLQLRNSIYGQDSIEKIYQKQIKYNLEIQPSKQFTPEQKNLIIQKMLTSVQEFDQRYQTIMSNRNGHSSHHSTFYGYNSNANQQTQQHATNTTSTSQTRSKPGTFSRSFSSHG